MSAIPLLIQTCILYNTRDLLYILCSDTERGDGQNAIAFEKTRTIQFDVHRKEFLKTILVRHRAAECTDGKAAQYLFCHYKYSYYRETLGISSW